MITEEFVEDIINQYHLLIFVEIKKKVFKTNTAILKKNSKILKE